MKMERIPELVRKPEPPLPGHRQIDWTRELVTSHERPRPVVIRTDEPLTTQRKRVEVPNKEYSDYGEWNKLSLTTWLYDESGYCRRYDTYEPNDNDLQYADEVDPSRLPKREGPSRG